MKKYVDPEQLIEDEMPQEGAGVIFWVFVSLVLTVIVVLGFLFFKFSH